MLSKLTDKPTNEEAYTYFKLAITAKDSILNQQKVLQMQNLVINEQFRQQEIEATKLEADELRVHNLQLFAMAVFVISFFLYIILLVRKKSQTKYIETFGTISLLMLFEFISLLIHPFLEKITNHTPIFMLILLVIISSILVPLHHKLTGWLKGRMNLAAVKSEKIESD